MPNINLQKVALPRLPLTLLAHTTQQPHGDHIVQPVVIPIARLKQHPQLQPAARLRGPGRLQQDVRAVVRAEIVPCVRAENPRLRIREAPVGAEVQDFACVLSAWISRTSRGNDEHTSESGTGEVAADDGDGLANSARALGLVEAVFAFGVGGVEESEAWGWGFGDGGVLSAGEEGQRGEGYEFGEIHG